MDTLIIAKTDFTPLVTFDPASNYFSISGVSRPENVSHFYNKINDWIAAYEIELFKLKDTPASPKTLTFDFKFDYFNSASAKMLYIFLEKLSRIAEMGFNVTINWYSEEGDDKMKEDGQELSESLDLPFVFIAI